MCLRDMLFAYILYINYTQNTSLVCFILLLFFLKKKMPKSIVCTICVQILYLMWLIIFLRIILCFIFYF
jgi:hypothetical protein